MYVSYKEIEKAYIEGVLVSNGEPFLIFPTRKLNKNMTEEEGRERLKNSPLMKFQLGCLCNCKVQAPFLKCPIHGYETFKGGTSLPESLIYDNKTI